MSDPLFIETSKGLINLAHVTRVDPRNEIIHFIGSSEDYFVRLDYKEIKELIVMLADVRPELFLYPPGATLSGK